MITECKRVEAALQESEARFRGVFEQAAVGIIQVDLDGKLALANPGFCEIVGYTQEEVLGLTTASLTHPDDLVQDAAAIAGALRGEISYSSNEERYIRKDGSVVWVKVTRSAVYLPSGQPYCTLAIVEDINRRKEAEEELLRVRDELEPRLDGSLINFSVNAASVRDVEGEVVAATSGLEGISELKQTEEALRIANERLRELSSRLLAVQEEERRSIARELHDEIGQYLTGLKIILDLAARPSRDEVDGDSGREGKERREGREDEPTEAQGIVNDLMARVRELSLDLRPSMLDDMGLVPALAWHSRRYSEQTGIKVDLRHVGLGGRFAPEVETAVYRVVQEALTNVARHSGAKEVTVQVLVDGSIIVVVEDQGAGFDVDGAMGRHTSSGLSGMRERAELLGGTLSIESRQGEGTVLIAEIPLQRVEE